LSDLQDRLQQAVGNSYQVEKELGGGGMSRVFLANETNLNRKVVIKLLPPEMAAGVNRDRFYREVQLAASLQHPHIVPLLTADSQDDLLYYVMPYIEGESLRAKLAREGELPVAEAARILGEVADALSHAHGQGIVHRDIKPDNVLLSGKHAVVTDFGVAKAVSASADSGSGSSLTSLGVALGTPAYMAPEQAAASPNVDHRADIYALGALAYEMLTGQPPFTGANPQAVLAAHVSRAPEPVTSRRPAVPAGMNELVMRCLEKRAADRWQSAEHLLPILESMSTPSGGTTPTATAPYLTAAARPGNSLPVAGLFLLSAVAVLGMVYFLVVQLGLPDWVLPGAVALLLAGLPIMLLTGRMERRRAVALTTGTTPPPSEGGIHGLLTWRKAISGGLLAFVALGIGAAGYTAMRLLGIGPVGTLVASGVLEAQGTLVLADFENRTADSTLGPGASGGSRSVANHPVVRPVIHRECAGAHEP
jgi:serine/threonine-protein kinase